MTIFLICIQQEDADLVYDCISRINYFSYFDNEIAGIITNEAADFFEGKKTEQEVAQIIQRKVSLYLNEQ